MSGVPEGTRNSGIGGENTNELKSNLPLGLMALASGPVGAEGDGGASFVPSPDKPADGSDQTSGPSDLLSPVEDLLVTDPVLFAQDDIYIAHEDQADLFREWLRLGSLKFGTDLLANDGDGAEIVAINGQPFEKGSPFDGDNGGEFRVHIGGVLDFRNNKSWYNPGETIEEGETTGFTYSVVDDEGNQHAARAEVSLKPILAVADSFDLKASELIEAGKSYLRLAAKNDHTDLLENDFGADESVLVNGAPIEEGVWFAGDNGGEFRVFAGGVLDFRNQGTPIAPGDATGFSYTARGADGLLNVADVLLEIKNFPFIPTDFQPVEPDISTSLRFVDLDPYVGVEILPPSVFNPYIPVPAIDPVDSFDLL